MKKLLMLLIFTFGCDSKDSIERLQDRTSILTEEVYRLKIHSASRDETINKFEEELDANKEFLNKLDERQQLCTWFRIYKGYKYGGVYFSWKNEDPEIKKAHCTIWNEDEEDKRKYERYNFQVIQAIKDNSLRCSKCSK